MFDSTIKVAVIVATAVDGVIGSNNQLPWHLPQDLKYFKSITLGKPVIMGRKTYESIGRPLPGRANLVISRNTGWQAEGVEVFANLAEAIVAAKQLAAAANQREIMIIGGAEIYRTALPLADRVYLTEIDLQIVGDAWFPPLPSSEWELAGCIEGAADASLAHRFKVFERLSKSQ